MPVMSGEVYDALTEAGASAEKARKAAEAVAGYDGQLSGIRTELTSMRGELTLLKWMVGFNVALSVAVIVRLFAG